MSEQSNFQARAPDSWLLCSRPRMQIGSNEVHVWRFSLDVSRQLRAQLAETLSSDELDRAARFVFQNLRERFAVAHGIRRDILSRYVGDPPAKLTFASADLGKPALEPGYLDVRFNASRSLAMGLLAIACGREIGVDIEAARALNDASEIVDRYFSPREASEFRALPDHERNDAFLSIWTRKEAYLKAIGAGLSVPLNSFDVSVGGSELPRLLRIGDDTDAVNRWRLVDLYPAPDYAGALAIETGTKERIDVHQFEWAGSPARR